MFLWEGRCGLHDSGNLIGKWTSVLYRYRKAFMARRLEKFGIVGGMFVTLLTVKEFNGASQERISDYLKIDKTTTAKAIKKLESEGYVRPEPEF